MAATADHDEQPPKESVEISQVLKLPPPENADSIRIRSLVVLSFWAVVVVLGIPLWWVTTLIYRAPLPLKEMQSWAEGRACRAEFPLLVDVEADHLQDPEHMLKTVQHALDDANDFSAHHLRLRLAKKPVEGAQGVGGGGEHIAATLRLLPGVSNSPHFYKLSNSTRNIDLFYSPSNNPSSAASSSTLSVFVANALQEIFAEEQQMISYLLSSHTPVPTPSPSSAPSGSGLRPSKLNTAEMARKMSRIMRYAPTYHVTFSMFTGSASPISWEIEAAIQEYLQPLFDALGGISNFTVDSQIQFYASLSSNVIPTRAGDDESKSGKWVLKKQDLSSFINSAEWPLVSITNYPTINFIVYIPSKEQSPLAIPESATNAFLLPQWGGVKILNPDSNKRHLTKEDLKPSLDIFAAQLLALLGAPSQPTSLPFRLDSLTRQRSAELLTSASSTLGSLARLTDALPSIAIPTSVSTAVASTLSSLRNACQELKRGRFSGEGGALAEGRNAATEAEKAFFEKSMVGQVYFPEEHKVAVYLPLMGPVGVPLLMSAAREVGRFLKQWRESRRH